MKLDLSDFLLAEIAVVDPDGSYRRILVTDWVRRQRFELAI
jgi:hypothetical protein